MILPAAKAQVVTLYLLFKLLLAIICFLGQLKHLGESDDLAEEPFEESGSEYHCDSDRHDESSDESEIGEVDVREIQYLTTSINSTGEFCFYVMIIQIFYKKIFTYIWITVAS